MSIFSDFDAAYGGGYYNGLPSGDGSIDIFHKGTVVEHMPLQVGGMSTDFENGDFVIKTSNNTGGIDTFINGQQTEHREANIFGGENVYHGNELDTISIPNIEGGEDFYQSDMQQTGMSLDNIYGLEDYLSFEGNSDNILQYTDPLIHSSEYKMNPFDVSKEY